VSDPRYDDVSERSAAAVIRGYSGSFGAASLLLAQPVRRRIRNVYALVRVADEIVDHPDPGLARDDRARMLDELEADVHRAITVGHSTNLVVHAFARTAATCGIGPEAIGPFFRSMRTDLYRKSHDATTFADYVHGSAEVVGLMCLRVFMAEEPQEPDPEMTAGACRLGAAFQKLNFLRDLLGRSYFPGLDVERFCDADRDRLLDDIDGDLDAAARVIPQLPAGSRRAVTAAHGTFSELARRLRETPADEIRRGRVRVPTPVKARIVGGALLGRVP
jgi:phytoene synthase